MCLGCLYLKDESMFGNKGAVGRRRRMNVSVKVQTLVRPLGSNSSKFLSMQPYEIFWASAGIKQPPRPTSFLALSSRPKSR